MAKHGFSVSYWSFTFGATALASATPRAAGKTEDPAITSLAIGLFVLTNLTMLAILAGTAVLTGSGSLLPATVPSRRTSRTGEPRSTFHCSHWTPQSRFK
ncbi:potassium-tellurite ethidium and proflavin transporter [Sinorhizobium medicae]|uniref:potassium-tellurite ethidium and proflavin transporter n=1 Tax=Sinorhizobium medicae TaxID=110321 RepID=UPI00399B8750